MRDPARIDRVLALVRAYWKRYPDLRLGQLVVNLAPSGQKGGAFYYEDDSMEEALRRALRDGTLPKTDDDRNQS